MSIKVTITNSSDSFGLGTATVELQSACPHCGHQPQPREKEAETILARESHERILKCGDKLVLTALLDSGLPTAHY
jgi:hypothetical protein